MKYAFVILVLLLVPFPAPADKAAPVVYTRVTLRIIPKPAKPEADAKPQLSAPAQEELNKPTSVLPKLLRVPKEFLLDVRPLTFLSEHDFLSEQPFTDKGGILIAIDPPRKTSIAYANMLAKVDVLFLDQDGIIQQIAPAVSLRKMEEPLASDEPVRAIVFLKSGTAQMDDIRPGDKAENSLFKTHNVVLK